MSPRPAPERQGGTVALKPSPYTSATEALGALKAAVNDNWSTALEAVAQLELARSQAAADAAHWHQQAEAHWREVLELRQQLEQVTKERDEARAALEAHRRFELEGVSP